jgi:hypothetical protein
MRWTLLAGVDEVVDVHRERDIEGDHDIDAAGGAALVFIAPDRAGHGDDGGDQREEGERQTEAARGVADALPRLTSTERLGNITAASAPRPRRSKQQERRAAAAAANRAGRSGNVRETRSCREAVVEGFQQGSGFRDGFPGGGGRGFPGRISGRPVSENPVSAALRASGVSAGERIVAGDELPRGFRNSAGSAAAMARYLRRISDDWTAASRASVRRGCCMGNASSASRNADSRSAAGMGRGGFRTNQMIKTIRAAWTMPARSRARPQAGLRNQRLGCVGFHQSEGRWSVFVHGD